jgi:hypothetical protein
MNRSNDSTMVSSPKIPSRVPFIPSVTIPSGIRLSMSTSSCHLLIWCLTPFTRYASCIGSPGHVIMNFIILVAKQWLKRKLVISTSGLMSLQQWCTLRGWWPGAGLGVGYISAHCSWYRRLVDKAYTEMNICESTILCKRKGIKSFKISPTHALPR